MSVTLSGGHDIDASSGKRKDRTFSLDMVCLFLFPFYSFHVVEDRKAFLYSSMSLGKTGEHLLKKKNSEQTGALSCLPIKEEQALSSPSQCE